MLDLNGVLFRGRNLLSQPAVASDEIAAVCHSDRRWYGWSCGCSCSPRRLFSGKTEECIRKLLLSTWSYHWKQGSELFYGMYLFFFFICFRFVLNLVRFDQVTLLESRDRLGGRIHTDYTFGFPVDLGASWLALSFVSISKTLYRYCCVCLDLELHLTSDLQVARGVWGKSVGPFDWQVGITLIPN